MMAKLNLPEPKTNSFLKSLLSLSETELMGVLNSLTEQEAIEILHDWMGIWARENQIPPPGSWFTWLVLAGRGFGKTRCGAEWIRDKVTSGKARRIALVAPTSADARDTMVEGESGILSVFPPHQRPIYEPSKRRITFHTGAMATTYSADEPDRLRGPQHDCAWCDELAAWRYPEAYDMLLFGLRLGDPQCIVTTTPKNVKILRELIADPQTVITRGSTYENRNNLAPSFFREVVKKYENSTLGRQEIWGELLADDENALWKRENIENTRVNDVPELIRIVVAIDPSTTNTDDSAETGILVVGIDANEEGYVLDDLSRKASPHVWASEAIAAYHKWNADRIIAEANNGGDMIRTIIHTIDPRVPYKKVNASQGKRTRAEPVAALYEQGRVHHVGSFAYLEDQLCNWVPGEKSPDRLDALVWGLTELLLASKPKPKVKPTGLGKTSSWSV